LVPKAVDDDDAGWITPDNIGQMKRSASKVASLDDLVQRAKVGVACITTDYAMQNVIIQVHTALLLSLPSPPLLVTSLPLPM
jgi:RNA-binding protein NOB1